MDQLRSAKLLKQFGMSDCQPCVTPVISVEKAEASNNTEVGSVDFPYRSAVGALMYLMTGSRPDITYTVSIVSRIINSPIKSDVTQLKRIFCYLRGTTDSGIVYRPQDRNSVVCYSDSDHGGDKTNGRSTTGVICMYSGGAVSWISQRQASVAILPYILAYKLLSLKS